MHLQVLPSPAALLKHQKNTINLFIKYNLNYNTNQNLFLVQIKLMINKHFVPFCSISRCSQRISPTNGGASFRNMSRPILRSSGPHMDKLLIQTPSSENSCTAQFNHFSTWRVDHCWGSVNKILY